MELVKKRIKIATTTGLTSGNSYVIIPNPNAEYNFKILLTADLIDIGFLDADTNSDELLSYESSDAIMVTGNTSTSRLIELRKYTTSNIFENQYIGNGSFTNDGVDYSSSISGVSVTYYIGGIKYIDDIVNGITTYVYHPLGINSPDFINFNYFKDMKKENIISNPKINDDVFIVRQELSVFEDNYRLERIKSLDSLITYAGSKYYNIVKNS